MSKEDITPRKRLPQDIYDTAERVAEIVEHREAFEDAADLISDIMHELAGETGVSFDHPDLIRPFLIACARGRHSATYETFAAIRSACHFAASPNGLADLRRRLRLDDDNPPEIQTEMPAEAPTDNVVDLSCWIQSHPRPVRNLLFAEKEGGQDV